MLKILNVNENEVDIDIESFIKKNGPPNKITLVVNTRDEHHYNNHCLQFDSFMKQNYKNNIITNYFKGIDPPKGKSHHIIQISQNTNYHTLILSALLE